MQLRPTVCRVRATSALILTLALAPLPGCGGGKTEFKCEGTSGADGGTVDYLLTMGCAADFEAFASEPLDSSIPGARSAKVVFDTFDNDTIDPTLYFQNSKKYKIHYDFASEYLSGPARPRVPAIGEFNRTEYSSLDRRFVLGAITYYEGPKVWTLEIAPYDTATPAMIEKLYKAVKSKAFFGAQLTFHPTSEAVEAEAEKLPASVAITTTAQLFAAIDYQPLNLGSTVGRLRFVKAEDLDTLYLGFRDIVVLDRVPNDISVVAGMITAEFQTPLSHINVLAQNRHTPNMGLRNATTNAKLLALDGRWVELVVGAFEWDAKEKTDAESAAWWEINKPKPVDIPDMDLTERRLLDVNVMIDESGLPANKVGIRPLIQKALLAYGGKTANYAVLSTTEGLPVRKAFGIPVFYYHQFMTENGFFARSEALLADPAFQMDPAVRDAKLAELRADIEAAPVNQAFQDLLKEKLAADYPGLTMRFRTSTNAEDQEDFLCAGCYDSHTGDPKNWDVDRATCMTDGNNNCSVLQAIRKTWAGVWYFRTFEERAYHSIDHKKIGMALLVHHNFAAEEANGVAVTANIFDPSGLEPGFYANVQWGGDAEVVSPPPGISSDEIILYYDGGNVTPTYLSHSNLVPDGTTVLNQAQVLSLARALDTIQKRFSPAYGPQSGSTKFYAMDVEFKFDDEDNAPGVGATLLVKQARPYRGRGQ
jgi:pyruvate,water dikinase